MALDQYKDAVSNMLSAALDLKLGDAAPSKGFVDGAGEGEAEELLEDEFTHSDRLPPSDSWTGYTTLPTRDPCGQDDDDPHAVKDDEAMMRADRREEVEEEKGNGDSYDHERLPPILSLSGYSPISADEPAVDCGFAELPSDSRMNEDRIKATTHHVSTEDGWTLGLLHYAVPATCRRVAKRPIILCHGLACTHWAFDTLKEESLAWFLAESGYHTWLLDLRGAGLSAMPGQEQRQPWDFHSYVKLDAKAAIDYVCRQHGVDALHWAGHSMGGIIGLCLLLQPSTAPRIHSIIAISSALFYHDSSFRHLEPLAYLEPAISFLDVPTSTTLYSYLSLFPGLVHYPSNAHPTVIQDLLRNGFHRLPMKVLADLRSALGRRGMAFDFGQGPEPMAAWLSGNDRPVLMINGNKDPLCSLSSAKDTFRVVGGYCKRFIALGKESGCIDHYGHFDTLLGLRAREEVFPHILAWCREVDDAIDQDGEDEKEADAIAQRMADQMRPSRENRRWGEVEDEEEEGGGGGRWEPDDEEEGGGGEDGDVEPPEPLVELG